MKRSRRGGRRPQSSHNHNPNRTFDSSGPEIKIRGSAAHVYEKYLQLARDANASGDRIMAENYLQHAEHYYRILSVVQAQAQAQAQAQQLSGNGNGAVAGNGRGPQPSGGEAYNGTGSAPSFSLAEGDGAESDDEEEEGADAE